MKEGGFPSPKCQQQACEEAVDHIEALIIKDREMAEARISRLEQVLRPFADQAGRAEEAMRKHNISGNATTGFSRLQHYLDAYAALNPCAPSLRAFARGANDA
jgi:hypothetical protein